MITFTNLQKTIHEFGAHERAIPLDDIPWLPYAEGSSWKPVRFDVVNASWVALVRVDGPGRINRHQHTGEVLGYCLEGSWRYLEHDWVAEPGTFVYEPPGDVHTLVSDHPKGMVTLFLLSGTMRYMDDNDELIDEQDVFWYLDQYANWCRENGRDPDRELMY
jgi:2,4'-dihydroxyacetophenone dioxygenase